MNGIIYIIKKELLRVFSDKKLVTSLFILPVVIICGMYIFMGKMQSTMMNDIEKHKSIIYIQNAPEDFQKYVSVTDAFDADIKYLDSSADVSNIKKDIMNGNVDLLVVFEEGFTNKIDTYENVGVIPEVKTFYNNSEDYSNTARGNFVSMILEGYKQQLLAKRFGDLDRLTVFFIDKDPESSVIVDDQKATGKLFGTLLPYFITLMLFAGAMSLGVDAITGEKERGTMASMLLTPIKRKDLVLGKLLSLSILSSMSAAIYAVTMIVAMPIMLNSFSGEELGGLTLSFSPIQVIQLFAIMLSLVYLYVAIVSLAAVFAKTAKEANSYVTPIYIVVLAAGMVTMFTGNSEKVLGMYAIPLYGSALSMQSILIGELTLTQFGLSIGGTVILAGIITGLITRAFNSEKIMFNA